MYDVSAHGQKALKNLFRPNVFSCFGIIKNFEIRKSFAQSGLEKVNEFFLSLFTSLCDTQAKTVIRTLHYLLRN